MAQGRNSSKINIGTTIVVLAIIGIGFFIYATRIAPSSETIIKTLPVMRQALVSETDGSDHTVDVKFSIEITRKAENKVDMSEVEKSLQSSLQHISYNKLKEPNSVDYVRDIAKDELAKTLPADQLEEVYIGDIAVDFAIPEDSQGNSNILKGLFKNLD